MRDGKDGINTIWPVLWGCSG